MASFHLPPSQKRVSPRGEGEGWAGLRFVITDQITGEAKKTPPS
jgi:hypothetical protein